MHVLHTICANNIQFQVQNPSNTLFKKFVKKRLVALVREKARKTFGMAMRTKQGRWYPLTRYLQCI